MQNLKLERCETLKEVQRSRMTRVEEDENYFEDIVHNYPRSEVFVNELFSPQATSASDSMILLF
jgi:hypothetical protein